MSFIKIIKKQLYHNKMVSKSFSTQSFQDFVFNKRNIDNILKNIFVDKQQKKQKKEMKINKTKNTYDYLIPKFENDLFWCYYIIHNGITSYEMVHNNFKEEKMLQIELVNEVRKRKDILKKHKWKKTIIEDELVNCPCISLQCFFCICAIKNHNIVYIDNNKFFTLLEDIDTLNNLNVIVKKDNRYCLFIGDNKEKMAQLEKCRESYWKIENIAKPLRGISAYKLKDLQNICKKLGIDIYKNKTFPKKKSILYQEIREQL